MTSLLSTFAEFLTTPVSRFFGAPLSDSNEAGAPATVETPTLTEARSEALRLLSFQAEVLSELAINLPADVEGNPNASTTASDAQAMVDALLQTKGLVECAVLCEVPQLLSASLQVMTNADAVRSQLLMRLEGLTRSESAVEILRQQLEQTMAKVSAGEREALGDWQSRFDLFKEDVAGLTERILFEGRKSIADYFERPAITDAVASSECQSDVRRASALIGRLDGDLDCIVLDLTRLYESKLAEAAQLLAGQALQTAHDYIAECHAALDAQTEMDLHLQVPAFVKRDGISENRSRRHVAKVNDVQQVRVQESNPFWRALGVVSDDFGYRNETRSVTRYRVELNQLRDLREHELQQHFDSINNEACNFVDTAVRTAFDIFHQNVMSQLASLQGALAEASARHQQDQRTIRSQGSAIHALCMDLDDQMKDAQSLEHWLLRDIWGVTRHAA